LNLQNCTSFKQEEANLQVTTRIITKCAKEKYHHVPKTAPKLCLHPSKVMLSPTTSI